MPREPKKKPIMACLFCRQRKIACGHHLRLMRNRRCNQCRGRDLDCMFPKECRRASINESHALRE
ncbi:hypothetical protein BC835DRAFT_1290958 [Cytidiella melzeri]|nr:hypothetical protein BC835DRAFT_1290958 [Cytidiella melzeri]